MSLKIYPPTAFWFIPKYPYQNTSSIFLLVCLLRVAPIVPYLRRLAARRCLYARLQPCTSDIRPLLSALSELLCAVFVVVEHHSVVYHVVGTLRDLRFIWSLRLSAATSFASYFSTVGIHMLFTECVEHLPFKIGEALDIVVILVHDDCRVRGHV